ncbi:hypothetical protein K501DRAFT_336759 [Backusella circina FSU 941]|nr:hypothetical protein K501DRAFT_336759 [Backusella circina FSU 941]
MLVLPALRDTVPLTAVMLIVHYLKFVKKAVLLPNALTVEIFAKQSKHILNVHVVIKKKTGDLSQQQPILIYRNNQKQIQAQGCNTHQDARQEKNTGGANSHCTCPPKTTPTAMRSSSGQINTLLNVTRVASEPSFNQITTSEVTRESKPLLAPLCTTNNQPAVDENTSYSWALITSPAANNIELPLDNTLSTSFPVSTNDENLHLGFIFHKPSSQRFLDGQPRVRRRRSTNQKHRANNLTTTRTIAPIEQSTSTSSATNLSINTDFNLSTPPASVVSPQPTSEPMDIQFDYLTEQLQTISNEPAISHDSFMDDLTNVDEFTAILNNVLQKDNLNSPHSQPSTSEPGGSGSSNLIAQNNSNTNNVSTSSSSPLPGRSQCGSFAPQSRCCRPSGVPGGESVVITITPLTTPNNTEGDFTKLSKKEKQPQGNNYPTTTRVVTCYCGKQCNCPGCLVHPGNFLLGTDPYAGLLANHSSSASSSCYGSDDDDIGSIYSNSKNNYSFTF